MQTATEKSKAAIEALVAGKIVLTDEQARHLWLAVASLSVAARDAEHCAFMIMCSKENSNNLVAADFDVLLRSHLNIVREQMGFVRGLLGAVQ